MNLPWKHRPLDHAVDHTGLVCVNDGQPWPCESEKAKRDAVRRAGMEMPADVSDISMEKWGNR